MKSQFFIIGAVIIVVISALIYSYLSLSDYVIELRKPLIINYNWKSTNDFRIIYDFLPSSYYLYLNLSLPNATINESTIIVYDLYPRKWQLDGKDLIVDDEGIPVEKDIYVYFSNSSGEEKIFSNVPFVDNYYILKNYNVSYDENYISIGKMNISCYSCLNNSGPVFVKFYNSSTFVYCFDKFIKTNSKLIYLRASNYSVGNDVYDCSNGNNSFSNKYIIFDGNPYFEFSNLTGNVSCINNVWKINLTNSTNIIVSYEKDNFGYRFFGDYRYKYVIERAGDFFNRVLSNYSLVSSGTFFCGERNFGLLNDFGDLFVGNSYANNSFMYWNFSSLIFDGQNVQWGKIKLNGESLNYRKISENEIIGNSSCGNVTFEFFNMSPVVYFKLESNSVCNLTLPIGVGNYYRSGDYYVVENDTYVVEFTGDILGYSHFPYFLLRPNSTFYMIILKDKRDTFTPYFYRSKMLCPKI